MAVSAYDVRSGQRVASWCDVTRQEAMTDVGERLSTRDIRFRSARFIPVQLGPSATAMLDLEAAVRGSNSDRSSQFSSVHH